MPEPRTKCLSVAELERVNYASASLASLVTHRLAQAAVLAGDGNRERRLAERKCSGCFYVRTKMAGQAFTRWKCNLCSAEANHPNTAVPIVCAECSDTFDLCVSCGGDIEMKHRTKRFGRKAKRRRP